MAEENIEGQQPKQDRLDRRPEISTLDPNRATINIQQMRELAEKFAHRVFGNPEMAQKVRASGLIIRFLYYDELWGDNEVWITINCKEDPVEIIVDACEMEPDVAMKMHADLAHRFWMQKLNLTMAVARGWVIVKGALPKLMRLIPFIKPGYPLYKETLAEMGFFHLLNYPGGEAPRADAAQATEDKSENS